eukprot:gene9830-biopygen16749
MFQGRVFRTTSGTSPKPEHSWRARLPGRTWESRFGKSRQLYNTKLAGFTEDWTSLLIAIRSGNPHTKPPQLRTVPDPQPPRRLQGSPIQP